MYPDSAIIVKVLTKEEDSSFFQAALKGKSLSSSELAWSEVQSALLAKERARRITAHQCAEAWATFEHLVETKQIRLHNLNTVTLKRANRILVATHPKVALRTLDAIHLAACDLSQDFPLCATDKRMREAAAILKIPLFPEVIEFVEAVQQAKQRIAELDAEISSFRSSTFMVNEKP